MQYHSKLTSRAALLPVIALLTLTACTAPAPVADTRAQTQQPAPAAANAVNISRNPSEVPAPIARAETQTIRLDLQTQEVSGKLADGSTFTYWTFGGQVPGPMVRVRVGDTVELHIKNTADSKNVHSIDLHAVTGPGGGAVGTQVKAGEEKVIMFKALNPGVYVYHCASPHIPTHIAMGMYGLIVVEPAGGLPKVDREFYVMQGEIYTQEDRGTTGNLTFDGSKLKDERPTYVVFNGGFQALTGDNTMKVKVGERVRVFIGNGGPNLISNFHIIGGIFDKVYLEGASEPVSNVQTTLIPAGGAAMVEFVPAVPGNYTLVDHAISRAIDKGALATIHAEGADNPAVFKPMSGTETAGH